MTQWTRQPKSEVHEEPGIEPNRPETETPVGGQRIPPHNPGAPMRSYGTAADWGAFGKDFLPSGRVATSVPRILHEGASIEYQPLRERAERPASELLLVRHDSAVITV